MNIKETITIGIIFGILLLAIGCEEILEAPKQKTTVPEQKLQYTPGTYEEISFDFEEEVKTKQFNSEEELLSFISDNRGGSLWYYGGVRMTGVAEEVSVMAEAAESIGAPSVAKAGADLDFSETNIQVEGVDEADIIKTDGSYIYTVSGNVLFIVKAYPGEDAEVVSTVKFDNKPESLFIKEGYLAVFGNFHDNDYFKKINFRPRYGMTYLNIYDISDKDDPELVKEYKFEGNYFRGRMTKGYVYILTTTRPEYRPVPMPVIIESGVLRNIPIDSVHYYNVHYDDPMFVNIHAINLEDPDEDISSKAIVVEGSQNLYMSTENIYVTYTESINEYELQQDIIMELMEPKLTDVDKELIEKIKKTDNQVLSRWEKRNKIYSIYQTYVRYLTTEEEEELEEKTEKMLKERLAQYEYLEFTVINKVNVDEDTIKPTANGKVPGSIINQFSLDENDDILRIATTVGARWSRFEKKRIESTNNIYTLDEDLEILDELEGMAEGERIFSTRFIGDRLYMVTFRQVDPFFVIDLSNPRNILELGELKIPGFSRYLHPYDKDTIIGIGRDATETGRQQGLKISLFDVSDVQNPKEIAKYVAESRYSGTSAEYEHKAFLFSKGKELLVIPAYSYSYKDESENYNGAFVFEIKKDSIRLRGLIDHKQGGGRYWQPAVERSLYIEELLYTKSSNLLRINKIYDLNKVKNIDLVYKDQKIPVY